ncbi:hypothetical protein R8N45_24510, partial [Vibrio sp. 1403]|uniref:hypothetical protein n=1 Tax=Vibrio sp. 1403 TaxID=3074555 RepID=UPI002966B414
SIQFLIRQRTHLLIHSRLILVPLKLLFFKQFDYEHVAGFNHFLRLIKPFVSVVTALTIL